MTTLGASSIPDDRSAPCNLSPEGEKANCVASPRAGCFGCHMSFLDIDERLLELIEHVEFDRSPLTDIKHVRATATSA